MSYSGQAEYGKLLSKINKLEGHIYILYALIVLITIVLLCVWF